VSDLLKRDDAGIVLNLTIREAHAEVSLGAAGAFNTTCKQVRDLPITLDRVM
jgi:hypothetical protein